MQALKEGIFLFTYGIRSDRKIIYLFSLLCFILYLFVGASSFSFPIASFSISVENCGTYDTLYSCYQFLWIGLFVIFSDSDAPLLLVAFFSVGLIFLSGVSYPLELMPWYWQWIHYMVPAAPGTLAFVKINSMGASMSEISQQYIILWIQCAIYFVLACRAYRYNIKKAKCERQ